MHSEHQNQTPKLCDSDGIMVHSLAKRRSAEIAFWKYAALGTWTVLAVFVVAYVSLYGLKGTSNTVAPMQFQSLLAKDSTLNVGDWVNHGKYQKGYTSSIREYKKGHGLEVEAVEDKPRSIPGQIRGKSETRQIPFLFIHINKAGGTSMVDLLRNRCRKEYVVEAWGKYHRSFHSTAHSYIEHYGRDVFDQAYTFAVVRHPLARQVSNFFFLADRCSLNPSVCEERLIPTNIDMDSLSDAKKIEAFHKWISRLYKAHPPGSPTHYLFASRGHGNDEFETFGSTQTSWLVDSAGEIVVNDIFKLEELSQDMTPLAQAIPCLSGGAKKGNKVEMIKKNPSKAYPNFMLFSDNEKTKRIIKEVFAEDFENFGYEL